MSQGGRYIYGTDRKRELLEKEGISFITESVHDLKKIRVYPQASNTGD
jgi:hypothetical protein